MAAALENIDRAMVFFRPMRSASWPPTSDDRTSPTPHTDTARPARAGLIPSFVRYRTRKNMAKLANRLTNDPPIRIHAGRGSSRTFRRRVR